MRKDRWLFILLGGLLLLSLSVGSSSAFSWVGLFSGDKGALRVFLEARLPRTISIVLSAGSVSLSGLLMQTITQNRYAGPSTTGTVEAAQLGMLVSLFFFPQANLFQKMTFAFVATMGASLLFLTFVRKCSFHEKWMLPLVGILFGGIIGAIAEMIAYRFQLVQSMSSWTQGSYTMIQRNQFEWLFLTIVVCVGIWFFTESFSLMALGESASRSLGLPFQKMEQIALFLVALSTAVTMITVGGLPFLGIIIPNLVRQRYGDYFRKIRGKVFLVGVLLVLCCDIVARLVVWPYELSISVVLGVLGSVFLIRVLWKEEKHAAA
ncbi:iron chelate uptake ABC transporter family permease subunit [Streptococcus gallinaceus]|uniref:Iron complex transport system permease protein n=1 Tax=Streptococcus gallinaceus TaxID=165758 RepID=A0ABV2JMV6_9STRE